MTFDKNTGLQSIVLVSIGILLYINTLGHGFVLDDEVVIVKNTFVQQGIDGIFQLFTHDSFAGYERVGTGESLLEGGRYRPLSLVFYTLIYSLFGANPLPFHLFNIGLYALCGWLFFMVLRIWLKEDPKVSWIAFFAALLFIVHPVHTEVVANIKSADELLALAFGLLATWALFEGYDTGRKWPLVISGVLLLLACLAKENAITWLVLAPVALWYFRKVRLPFLWPYALPLLFGAGLFLMLRENALGGQIAGRVMHDPMNNPFLEWNGDAWVACSLPAKVATLLYIFWRSVLLLIAPFTLTHDYYPFHIALQSFFSVGVLGGLLVLAAFMLLIIKSIRDQRPEGYGILFFLGTLSLTANIFFPVGTFMAERFLFLPSIGFILAAVWLSAPFAREKWFMAGAIIVMILFSVKTIMRNAAWKDNETLLRTDVRYSPKSAKLQNDLGTILLDNALKVNDAEQQRSLLEEALPHLKKAIDVHPTYYDALLAYGACAYYLTQYDQSVSSYRSALQRYPEDNSAKTGLIYALQAYGKELWLKGDTLNAINALVEAWGVHPDSSVARQLSEYYNGLNQPEKSLEWETKAKDVSR
jgi:hypothetical protein